MLCGFISHLISSLSLSLSCLTHSFWLFSIRHPVQQASHPTYADNYHRHRSNMRIIGFLIHQLQLWNIYTTLFWAQRVLSFFIDCTTSRFRLGYGTLSIRLTFSRDLKFSRFQPQQSVLNYSTALIWHLFANNHCHERVGGHKSISYMFLASMSFAAEGSSKCILSRRV